MIDEYFSRLLSTLERCATALEALSAQGMETKPVVKAPKSAPEPLPEAISPPATPAPPSTNGHAAIEPESPVAYETLRLAVVELAKVKGHKLAMSMLEEFGVTTGKDLPPAQYSKALKRAKELLK